MGVEVRLNSLVTGLSRGMIELGDERIPVRNVFWAAGVRASSLGSAARRASRSSRTACSSMNRSPCRAIRRSSWSATWPRRSSRIATGWVPGVAQGALQMGRHAGRAIAAEVAARAAGTAVPSRSAFRYCDRGSMAVIGKSRAVAQIGRFDFGGFVAWLLWGVVHIMALVGFRNRAQVALSWMFSWLVQRPRCAPHHRRSAARHPVDRALDAGLRTGAACRKCGAQRGRAAPALSYPAA